MTYTTARMGQKRRYTRRLLAFAVGFTISAALLTLAEFAARRYYKNFDRENATAFHPEIYVTDPYCGIAYAPNATTVHTKGDPENPRFRAEYSTDKFGRRTSACANPHERPFFAAFFGGSYSFGQWLDEADTLPSQFAQLAEVFVPYNYALPGYGTAQVYAQFQHKDLTQEIDQPRGVAIYVFIGHHVRRALPSMRVYTTWGRNYPACEIVQGELRISPNFASAHPRTADFYDWIGKSALLRLGGFDIPYKIGPSELDVLAALIEGSQARFASMFPDSEFVTVLYPGAAANIASAVESVLTQRGLHVLNYDGLLDDMPLEEAFQDNTPPPPPTMSSRNGSPAISRASSPPAPTNPPPYRS